MKRSFLVFFVLWGLFGSVGAQDKALDRAEALYNDGVYPAAIKIYERVLTQDMGNRRAMIGMAKAQKAANNPRQAYRYYARAVKYKNIEPEMYLDYGQILMQCRKYEEALPWLEKYQQLRPDDDRTQELIESCTNLDLFFEKEIFYVVKRLSINSEASDFGAAFWQDQLIFASARKRSIRKDRRTGQSFLDLYQAPYDGTIKLGEPTLFRSENDQYHEATACFSEDGSELFFTRNQYKKEESGLDQKTVSLAIYRVAWDSVSGKWGKEEALPFNHKDYSVGHPCLDAEGRKLYFASNMPGGSGETDLYVVERTDSGWGTPQNLGPEINSAGNELFPWMNANGELFFATNGRGGLGGLDIFRVDPESGKAPENMGAPINSGNDDFGLAFDETRGIGFFTSNRPGGVGDDDLYAVTRQVPFYGFVCDETGNALGEVKVLVRAGRSRKVVETDETGKFMMGLEPGVECSLTLRKSGFEDIRETFVSDEEGYAQGRRFVLKAGERE